MVVYFMSGEELYRHPPSSNLAARVAAAHEMQVLMRSCADEI